MNVKADADAVANAIHSALDTFRRQYFALYPSYLIFIPPPEVVSTPQGQAYLLNKVLGLDHGDQLHDVDSEEAEAQAEGAVQKFDSKRSGAIDVGVAEDVSQRQPEDSYRRKIWRRVVQATEEGVAQSGDEDAEVDERFYELLSGLMVSDGSGPVGLEAGPSTEPKTSYRTFIYDLPEDHPLLVNPKSSRENLDRPTVNEPRPRVIEERQITLLEEQIAIQGGTTGLRTWTAALHLGHHIIHHPQLLFPGDTQHSLPIPGSNSKSDFSPPPYPSFYGDDGGTMEQIASQSQSSGILSSGVIELGAGTGLLSILLSQLGVDVIATDLGIESESDTKTATEPRALPGGPHEVENHVVDDLKSAQSDKEWESEEGSQYEFGVDGRGETRTPLGRLKYNVSLNASDPKPIVRALDWTDASLPPDARPVIWKQLIRERRTVIAADVIYDPDLVPPLVDAISTLIGPEVPDITNRDGDPSPKWGNMDASSDPWASSSLRPVECVISATVRNQTTFDKFLATCESINLSTEIVDLPRMDQSQSPTFWDSALDAGTEVKIMRIRRNGGH
ncbi:hypothetical protein I317_05836 [Kwoniella heveanensis CBS 569]|nr:hypothetical protein I317_05836 [Kwoniella heveanensis CBS 569]